MTAVASPDDLTIEDFDTPIERALHLAESIHVSVDSFPTHEPSELIDQTLALLFLTGGGDDPFEEHMLIRDDVDDDERAAAIMFGASIVTVFRDVDPSIWQRLMCRLDEEDEQNCFIAISRKRLPAPTERGYAYLSAMLGERLGLSEPAVFEVIGAA